MTENHRLLRLRAVDVSVKWRNPRRLAMLGAAGLAIALASCAPKPEPAPPPPPPPPPVAVIPPRPVPPLGASPNMVIPAVDTDGTRVSVNRKVSTNQLVWNLRSAFTVAALNCQGPAHAAILPRYKVFLTRHARALKAVYDGMDHDFRAKYGRGGETLRDDYLTTLYNHYALPPTLNGFCDVVDKVMADSETVQPAGLADFATAQVPVIEQVFDDFYAKYDQYKNALAEWDEKYGRVGRVQVGPAAAPGPVAVNGGGPLTP